MLYLTQHVNICALQLLDYFGFCRPFTRALERPLTVVNQSVLSCYAAHLHSLPWPDADTILLPRFATLLYLSTAASASSLLSGSKDA